MKLPFYDPEAAAFLQYYRRDSYDWQKLKEKYHFNVAVILITQVALYLLSMVAAMVLIFVGAIFGSYEKVADVVILVAWVYLLFTLVPMLGFRLLKKLHLIQAITATQQEPRVVYDNIAAAEVMAETLQTKGVTDVTKPDILSLLSARDGLADGSPGAPNPQEALWSAAKARGLSRESTELLDEGEEKYLTQLGLIKPPQSTPYLARGSFRQVLAFVLAYGVCLAIVLYSTIGRYASLHGPTLLGVSLSLRGLTLNGLIFSAIVIALLETTHKHHPSHGVARTIEIGVVIYLLFILVMSPVFPSGGHRSFGLVSFIFGATLSLLVYVTYLAIKQLLFDKKRP